MVPPHYINNRTIGTLGMSIGLHKSLSATIQLLWLASYLSGDLHIVKTQEEIEYDTVLHGRFCRWRDAVGYRDQFPDFAFDSLPYLDLILGVEDAAEEWALEGATRAVGCGGLQGS